MSEVKRYEVYGHDWDSEANPHGFWVMYADYAALEAECENLRLSWGLLRSENNALRQQLAEMTEQRDSFQRAGIRAMEQRDKMAAALERIADTDPDDGTAWFHDVANAALAEIKP
jgi:hypothetical protein